MTSDKILDFEFDNPDAKSYYIYLKSDKECYLAKEDSFWHQCCLRNETEICASHIFQNMNLSDYRLDTSTCGQTVYNYLTFHPGETVLLDILMQVPENIYEQIKNGVAFYYTNRTLTAPLHNNIRTAITTMYFNTEIDGK